MKICFKILVLIAFFHTSLLAQTKLKSDEFAKQIEGDTNIQLVDVRTPAEFGEGYLPNAKNIDYKNAKFAEKIQTLDKSKPVYVYCLAGSRSESAAKILADNGYQVFDLEGGYLNWTHEKRAVTGIKAAAKPATVGISVDEFNTLIQSEQPVLVDFTAKWCKPCVAMAPSIKKIDNEFKGKAVVKVIDIDKNPTITSHLGIQYLPLIQLYKNGQVVWKTTGAVTEAKLREVMKAHL